MINRITLIRSLLTAGGVTYLPYILRMKAENIADFVLSTIELKV